MAVAGGGGGVSLGMAVGVSGGGGGGGEAEFCQGLGNDRGRQSRQFGRAKRRGGDAQFVSTGGQEDAPKVVSG